MTERLRSSSSEADYLFIYSAAVKMLFFSSKDKVLLSFAHFFLLGSLLLSHRLVAVLMSSLYQSFGASLVAQTVKNLPAVQETWVRSLDWEDPLEKGTLKHPKELLSYQGSLDMLNYMRSTVEGVINLFRLYCMVDVTI